MAKEQRHAWMVRSGNDNELAPLVEAKNAAAIGGSVMGDVSNLKSREAFKEAYRQAYPDHSEGRTNVGTGQIFRFACVIAEGDYVLTYIKDSREVLIGTVTGPYAFNPALFSPDYPQVRPVTWHRRVSRDDFSTPARNALGSALTVFQVDDHLSEIQKLAAGKPQTPEEDAEEEEAPPFYEEVSAKATELIADLISGLDPYDFQDLVAAVLRAMGFRAISSNPGRDLGVDIIAHPDALGFDRPRIKVQVKHRKDSSTGPEMRSFLGALRTGDSGLYVSTGGFTSDAKSAAENSREPVTLLDRDGFIRLLLEYYEVLEPEHKSKVPLRKVWVPTK
jgi:restriction system protein